MRTVRSSTLSLLTEPETQLVHQSAPRNLTELSERQLKQHVARARRLRDKYQGLAKRQTREARRKAPARGQRTEGSPGTERKAALFDQALERFEKRLEKLTRAAQRPAPRTAKRPASVRSEAPPKRRATPRRATSPAAPVVSRKTKRGATAPMARKARSGAAKEQGFNLRRRNAQVSASVRQSQARRDRRR